jgi:hypothetical protein
LKMQHIDVRWVSDQALSSYSLNLFTSHDIESLVSLMVTSISFLHPLMLMTVPFTY